MIARRALVTGASRGIGRAVALELGRRGFSLALSSRSAADLAETAQEWIIVFFHHPPYTKGSHNSDAETELIEIRQNILPILEANGVDLVLSGHSHAYERSFLLNGHYGLSSSLTPTMRKDSGTGRTNDTGAYIKSAVGPAANLGAVYVVAGSSGFATSGAMNHPAMCVSYLRMGSLVLDVNGHRLDAAFIRETGAIDDYFTIQKATPAEPLRTAVFRKSGAQVISRWKSIAGNSYKVQRTSDLSAGPWVDFSAVVTASGATTSSTNAAPVGGPHFFRVVQTAP